jgi:2-keto-3-deoxy-L-rhamnonate aldolase RhmA
MTFDLFAFCTDPALARRLDAAGVDGFVIDWERRDKDRRQHGWSTQINSETPADLRNVRRAVDRPILCRVNAPSPLMAKEIAVAISLGADEVLIPMVRSVAEVEAALDAANGDAGVGILVETDEAVALAPALGTLPLSRVYVGLNDLAIAHETTNLFRAVVDGTVDRVRAAFDVPLGFAGLTHPSRGAPVPCDLIVAALTDLGADFTFLRRSFFADLADYGADEMLGAIRSALTSERQRSAEERLQRVAAFAHAVDRLDRDGVAVLRQV